MPGRVAHATDVYEEQANVQKEMSRSSNALRRMSKQMIELTRLRARNGGVAVSAASGGGGPSRTLINPHPVSATANFAAIC